MDTTVPQQRALIRKGFLALDALVRSTSMRNQVPAETRRMTERFWTKLTMMQLNIVRI